MENTNSVIEEIGGIVLNDLSMPPMNDEEGSVVVPSRVESEVQLTSINPPTPKGEQSPWL
jgi:hypothetical protein